MASKPPLLFRLRSSWTQIRNYSAPLDGQIPTSKQKYVPTSGTYPKGFLASGTHVGVKPTNTRFPDLALVASEIPCSGAAVFTQNKFQAAPVVVSREMLQRRAGRGVRAIVVNSGCANAVTGKKGMDDAQSMGEKVDECFEGPVDSKGSSTVVMSTGVIGQPYATQPAKNTQANFYVPEVYPSKRSSTKSQKHTPPSPPRTQPG